MTKLINQKVLLYEIVLPMSERIKPGIKNKDICFLLKLNSYFQ